MLNINSGLDALIALLNFSLSLISQIIELKFFEKDKDLNSDCSVFGSKE